MMRRLLSWLTSSQVRIAQRKRRHEKKLRAMGVTKTEAVRIASARYGNERR